MNQHAIVNGLPLPPLLVLLMQQGQWVHPGDAKLRELIPFLVEPVDFLKSPERMATQWIVPFADDPRGAEVFRVLRGSRAPGPSDLPWLDVELSIFIALSAVTGDDTGIALDYRLDKRDPRVVAGDWNSSGNKCYWREVSRTFSQFVELLRLPREPA